MKSGDLPGFEWVSQARGVDFVKRCQSKVQATISAKKAPATMDKTKKRVDEKLSSGAFQAVICKSLEKDKSGNLFGFVKPLQPSGDLQHRQSDYFFFYGKSSSGHINLLSNGSICSAGLPLIQGDVLIVRNLELKIQNGKKTSTLRVRYASLAKPRCLQTDERRLLDYLEGLNTVLKDETLQNDVLACLEQDKSASAAVWSAIALLHHRDITDSILSVLEYVSELCYCGTSIRRRRARGSVHTMLTSKLSSPDHCFLHALFKKKENREGRKRLVAVLLKAWQYFPSRSRHFLFFMLRSFSESFTDEAAFLLPVKTMLSLLQSSLHGGDTISCYSWRDLPLQLLSSEFMSLNEVLLHGLQESRPNLIKVLSEGGSYETFDRYMEVYVGLLREDCFASMRNGLKALSAGTLDEHEMRVFLGSTVVAMSPPIVRGSMEGTVLELIVPCSETEMKSPPMFGSLLLLAPQGDLKSKHLIWATVAGSEVRSAFKDKLCVFAELCSELNADSEASLVGTLLRASGQIMVVESPTFYRAYAPAIQALQSMTEETMPSFELIVKGSETNNSLSEAVGRNISLDASIIFESETRNLKDVSLDEFLSMLRAQIFRQGSRDWTASLDSSQAKAIHAALTRKISIIQGPPGTGKTFVGVKIVQLLLGMKDIADVFSTAVGEEGEDKLEDKNSGPLLVLTFKNRALDDFLEDCLNVWPEGVARIGGSACPGSCLEQRHIRVLMRSEERRSSEAESARKHAVILRDEVQEKAKALKRAMKFSPETFLGSRARCQLRSLLVHQPGALSPEEESSIEAGMEESPMKLPENWKDVLKTWLPDRRLCDKMAKKSSPKSQPGPSYGLRSKENLSFEEKSNKAHERNQFRSFQEAAVRFDDKYNGSYDDSRNVLDLLEDVDNMEEYILLSEKNIWSIDKASRVKLMSVMAKKDFAEAERDYDVAMDAYVLALERIRALELADQTKLLRKMKVVGMTISGAAIYRDIIEELKPKYVLIEEAAEVLEPQLIAALGPWVQRLILIGDHQQLRPSVENHILAHDYNFNTSMMERLVKNQVMHVTLTKQARMRPEFATLLNDEYPKLESSHRVLSRSAVPPPCGMSKTMYWWDTSSNEEVDNSARSYINTCEASAVSALFSHLTRSGVPASSITILASYSAQVELIKGSISKLVDVGDGDWPHENVHGVASKKQLELLMSDSDGTPCEKKTHQLISIADTMLKVGDAETAIVALNYAFELEGSSTAAIEIHKRATKLQKLTNTALEEDFITSLKSLESFSTKCQSEGDIACAAASCLALERTIKKAEKNSTVRDMSQGQMKLVNMIESGAHKHLRELRAQNSVTVSSIDRYQGSENDILIISLVRSNVNGKIGFLKEPARRVVAQSRAKFGMYFVGNQATFQAASKEWDSLISNLEAQNLVSSKLPLCCPRHATSCTPCVESDETGIEYMTKGICHEICGCIMSCGQHSCKKICHGPGGENGDLHTICRENVPDKCGSGHNIERACFQRSTDVECEACKKREAAQRKKEEEERKVREKAALAQVEKEIKQIKSRAIPNSRRDLGREGADALEFANVRDRTEKYVQLEHGYPIIVTRIEELTNQSLEIKFLEAKMQLFSGAEKPNCWLLFHGTSTDGVASICENGFKLPARSKQNMFGCGIYFATDSSKSAQKIYTKGSNCLLLCDVLMGKSCRIGGLTEDHPLREFVRNISPPSLNVDAKIMKKKRFDSVYAQRDSREKGGVKYDEMIVYNEAQAIPRYIVHYSSNEDVSAAKKAIQEKQMLKIGEINLRKIQIPANMALYDPENVDEYHYRFVESQFHRMFRGGNKRIVCVEVVLNQRLLSAFEAKERKYKREKVNSERTLGFHGTTNESGKAICTRGFELAKVGTATDSGWYGAGIYFSFNTHTAVGYDKGCLLLCELLRGKTYKLTAVQRRDGEDCKAGYNSHTVEAGNEVVMFEMDSINPKYIVHYE